MKPVSEWTEEDINEFHRGSVMENQKLEYKDSRALANNDHHKRELFKDVSAMANSAGGIIIYGMKERGHLPEGTDDGVDPSVIKREWLENILTTNIDPKIEDLYIKPVILESKGTGFVAYVIEVPQARSRGPHQGPDHKYYKRHNFKAEPMEDYEVRDLMRRGIEYGRKYGAAFDLYIEIARLRTSAGARAGAGQLNTDKAIIGVSPDLRSAGAVLVLMSRYMRNAVGEIVQKVDGYNSKIEARGGHALLIDAPLKEDLLQIQFLSDEICTELKKILDDEP